MEVVLSPDQLKMINDLGEFIEDVSPISPIDAEALQNICRVTIRVFIFSHPDLLNDPTSFLNSLYSILWGVYKMGAKNGIGPSRGGIN